MKGKGGVPENLIARLWKLRIWEGRWLTAADGRRLKILWSGQVNHDGGPDFCNAIVDFDGFRAQGDIELDLQPGLWRAHGHHLGFAFNNVILHVVLWSNSVLYTSLQNGCQVPILPLCRYLPVPLEQLSGWSKQAISSACPCQKGRQIFLTPSLIQDRLESAGDNRFRIKANRFEAELQKEEASHVLYRGVMMALGYSRNKVPFRRLADRLPLRDIEKRGSAVERQALFFGMAGLLPSQRGSKEEGFYVESVERFWYTLGGFSIIPEVQWPFSHLRPLNSPLRRLAAMECLLERYRDGLLPGMVRLVRESFSRKEPGVLEEGLMVGLTGYWAEHFDFGRSMFRKSALLGRGRAGLIVADIILPFAYAWGQVKGEPALAAQSLDLYRRFPPLPENYITRQMVAQLFPGGRSGLRNSARVQQGMIYLYQTFCRTGRGEGCDLLGRPLF